MSQRLEIYRQILNKVDEIIDQQGYAPSLLPVIDAAEQDKEFASLLDQAAAMNPEYRWVSGTLELYYLLLHLHREWAP